MAIEVQDEKTFSNGITLENWVATLAGSIERIQKGISNTGAVIYRVRYNIHYFGSVEAYNNRLAEFWTEDKTLEIAAEDITGDIWTKIYNDIKSNYNVCSDI